MRTISCLTVLAAITLSGCAADNHRGNHRGYIRPPYGSYDRDRDRRSEVTDWRRMKNGDRVYRGRDGRYFCKRSDGTAGAITGALAGGVLGNLIAPGGSKTLGSLLGAGGGAIAGRAIDRDNIRCE